jgi:hypothetical protein
MRLGRLLQANPSAVSDTRAKDVAFAREKRALALPQAAPLRNPLVQQ